MTGPDSAKDINKFMGANDIGTNVSNLHNNQSINNQGSELNTNNQQNSTPYQKRKPWSKT